MKYKICILKGNFCNYNWVSFDKDTPTYFNLRRDKIVMISNDKRNHTGEFIFRYKKGTIE